MPKATISTEAQHYDLKSLPEGFVELRRMSYGKWLTRTEMAMHMAINGQGKGQGVSGEVKMANREVTAFEFKECIVTHNLEDDAGDLLDLTSVTGLERLDPKIGNEINSYIMQMHEFEENLTN